MITSLQMLATESGSSIAFRVQASRGGGGKGRGRKCASPSLTTKSDADVERCAKETSYCSPSRRDVEDGGRPGGSEMGMDSIGEELTELRLVDISSSVRDRESR